MYEARKPHQPISVDKMHENETPTIGACSLTIYIYIYIYIYIFYVDTFLSTRASFFCRCRSYSLPISSKTCKRRMILFFFGSTRSETTTGGLRLGALSPWNATKDAKTFPSSTKDQMKWSVQVPLTSWLSSPFHSHNRRAAPAFPPVHIVDPIPYLVTFHVGVRNDGHVHSKGRVSTRFQVPCWP